MKILIVNQRAALSALAWLATALLGLVAPVVALLILDDAPGTVATIAGPTLALGLMGMAMIASAATGHFWIGVFLSLLNGVCLTGLALWLGLPPISSPISTAIAIVIASLSFAARGALFARSALDKGWIIALFVVAGEAAILITALIKPGALPEWLLVLLPAQWANLAIQTSFTGTNMIAAGAALLALAGTAAATSLVTRLWPRRWPYLIMFTTWLCLSALVWHWPALTSPDVAAPAARSAAELAVQR